MEYLLITLLIAGYTIYLARKRAKEDQAVRDAAFEATMRGLEEKAKAEGTFVMSYFDTDRTKK